MKERPILFKGEMKHLDLFSGIGGFALAASWVWGDDYEIVSFCEIEPYCQKVLKKHWPNVPCHDDIKTLKGDSFGTVDLLTGGFPCQPFSVAGKQGGSTDDRYLWPEMFRVIQEAKPTWIIGENVAGIINMVEFEQCFIDLESEGYETQAFIIPACGVDAKHRRDRVWIIANRFSNRRGGNAGDQPRTEKKSKVLLKENGEALSSNYQEVLRDVPDTMQPRLSWFTQGTVREFREEEKTSTGGKSSGRNTEKEQWRTWPVEPTICRVANGIPNRTHRLKGLGNAIVPQVVVPIMQAIKEVGI